MHPIAQRLTPSVAKISRCRFNGRCARYLLNSTCASNCGPARPRVIGWFGAGDGLRTELRDNEVLEAERLKSLADAAFEGIVIHQRGTVLDVNDAACNLLDVPREQILGQDFATCFGIECPEPSDAADFQSKTFRQRIISTTLGDELTVEVSARMITYRRDSACVVALRDISERIVSDRKIEFLAHCDHLTGLSNRFKFNLDLDQSLKQNKTTGITGAVFCLDLDGFKKVNDFAGHASGDEVLKQVGDRLKTIIGDTGTVARLGGDEFAIAILDPTRDSNVEQLAERIISTISTPYVINGLEFRIGASVGIARCCEVNCLPRNLLKQADIALYEAKRAGKGKYQTYSPTLETNRLRSLAIERGLRTALSDDLIDAYFQPQMNAQTGEISGFEALARWNDPVLGPVSPEEFIPIAEQSGLIMELGTLLQRKVFENAATWPPHYKLAINISPAELANHNLVANIREVLRETNLCPSRLELEITETALMQDETLAMASILDLKKLGISIAIDDFGTGYSSLSFLLRFPFDRIKIDKSFIMGMEDNQEAEMIVRSIINLGNSLNIGVIAEGVETQDMFNKLTALQCGEVQGFYVGRPTSHVQLPSGHDHDQAQSNQNVSYVQEWIGKREAV